MNERERLIKECSWSLLPVLQPNDPKNNDFFEADVSKIKAFILADRKAVLDEVEMMARGNGCFYCEKICETIARLRGDK